MFGLALIVSGSCLVPTLAFHEYRISLDNNVDRTLDLSDLGVNLTSTFNQLLPAERICKLPNKNI